MFSVAGGNVTRRRKPPCLGYAVALRSCVGAMQVHHDGNRPGVVRALPEAIGPRREGLVILLLAGARWIRPVIRLVDRKKGRNEVPRSGVSEVIDPLHLDGPVFRRHDRAAWIVEIGGTRRTGRWSKGPDLCFREIAREYLLVLLPCRHIVDVFPSRGRCRRHLQAWSTIESIWIQATDTIQRLHKF